jgi:hypothetical protein
MAATKLLDPDFGRVRQADGLLWATTNHGIPGQHLRAAAVTNRPRFFVLL